MKPKVPNGIMETSRFTPLSPFHLPSSRPRVSLVVETIPVSLMRLHLYDRWLASLCFSAGAGFEVQHNCCSRCYLGFMKDPFLQVRAFALEGLLGFYECDRESSDVVFLLAKPSSLART
ncbi:hypothetical protein JHK85_028351 [Glycine max]|nr:hypothetical protein JHK85_028351 [Glycine max]